MDITVYTIVYNQYGKFLKQWITSIEEQVVQPKEIIVVLGENSGVDKKEFKNIKFIDYNSSVMGTLRNVAIKEIKTEWMLYFSVDDVLLPNAISEIATKSIDNDAVALKFIEKGEFDFEKESAFFKNIREVLSWKKTNIPGYVAVKRKINNKINYYIEDEIPNYPYLFQLYLKKAKGSSTNNACAHYLKRKDGHGRTSYSAGRYEEFCKKINNILNEMFEDEIINYKKTTVLAGRGFDSEEAAENYMINPNFKRLSREEQEEFIDWFKRL